VDEKGFVKLEEFAEFCPEFVEGDKSLQPLVEKIARENLVTSVNNLSKSIRRQYKCNPAMIFAINNLYFKLQLACPDEFKSNITSDHNVITDSWTGEINLEKRNFILSRVRRKIRTTEPCCGETFYNYNIFEEDSKECLVESSKYGKDWKVTFPCLYECVGRELDLIDDEGYVKEDALLDFLPQLVEEDKKLTALLEKLATPDYINSMNERCKGVYSCGT
ncbi:hypothetical protein C0J52_04655, partial [Blattella germanica]